MTADVIKNSAHLQAYRVDPTLAALRKKGNGKVDASAFHGKGSLAERFIGKASSSSSSANNKKKTTKSSPTTTFDENVTAMTNLLQRILRLTDDNDDTHNDNETCVQELRDLVTQIGKLYNNSPPPEKKKEDDDDVKGVAVHFHGFSHACRVAEAAHELFQCILDQSLLVWGKSDNSNNNDSMVVEFAVVFAGLIHDAEHEGVPNAVLVQENSTLAARFQNRNVAERNSAEVGLQLFLSSSSSSSSAKKKFDSLQRRLFSNNQQARDRFESLVSQTVLATDIADKELQGNIRQRWADTVNNIGCSSSSSGDDNNGDITVVVLQAILQAADVSHTMDDFETYKEWNARLFDEMYAAYKRGRVVVADSKKKTTSKDPSKAWYSGEFGFLDFYVTPLVTRLEKSRVFDAATCQRLLQNVQHNRKQWEDFGRDIVRGYVLKQESQQQQQ